MSDCRPTWSVPWPRSCRSCASRRPSTPCSSPAPARCCAIPPPVCITAWARSPRPGPARSLKRVDRRLASRPFNRRGSRGSGDDGETRGEGEGQEVNNAGAVEGRKEDRREAVRKEKSCDKEEDGAEKADRQEGHPEEGREDDPAEAEGRCQAFETRVREIDGQDH